MYRGLGAAFCLLLFLAWAPSARAVFYNDTTVIEIEDGIPPPPPEGSTTYAQASYEWQGTIYSQANYAVIIEGDPENGGAYAQAGYGDGTPYAQANYTATPSTEDEEDEEDILEELLGGGVFGGTGVFGSAGGAGGSISTQALSESGGSITIDGRRVRDAFRGNFSLRDLLSEYVNFGSNLSAKDYGLIAASTAVRDSNVEMVSFSADAFEITYRSRGYLFGIFPKTFPVKITVIPMAQGAERVRVKLPWYRFFVREFFTAQSLAREINEVLDREILANTEVDADLNATLFTATAQFLRGKIGTVQSTVRGQ